MMSKTRVSVQIELLVLLLRSVQAQLRALDVAIKLLLQYLEDGNLPSGGSVSDKIGGGAVVADQESGDEVTEDSCSHPVEARTPAQTMGHPNRYYCRMCGGTVE